MVNINCIYNEDGAWCTNTKSNRVCLGEKCCVEYFENTTCQYKEKHEKPPAPPPPPPKRIINEDIKFLWPMYKNICKKNDTKFDDLKNFLNSSPNILIYMEEHTDIEESGNWRSFPDDFDLLLKIYKDNENAITFIKTTLAKVKKDFDKNFISLIGV